ncbi:MAG TPA: hypothetical protein VFW90_01250 [Candidatus Saccharimonadales bacterium]|nr:hypothetical protein [Candidatus Saccharimonadales bacterium]
MKQMLKLPLAMIGALLIMAAPVLAAAPPATNPQNGAVGLNGKINAAAPSQAPTITTPSSGASFTSLPIRVAGLCSSNLLIEVFKNNVFAGSTKCSSGSFSMQIDLFSGKNDLIARAYDALNQSSPDSNKVSVTFSDQTALSGPQVSLSTAYATRGANPGTALTWPLSISGGTAPYAISADWGDGSSAELVSQKFAGDFNISHVYKTAGTYNLTIKATDTNGQTAFLQVVAVANGTAQQSNANGQNSGGTTIITKIYWLPIIVLSILVLLAFWLGRRHQLTTIKGRLKRGQRPF